jgi:hypothetical protein
MYGATMSCIRSKDFDFVSYNGIRDKWNSEAGKPIPNDELHTTIKCEFTLKYCRED